MRKCLRCEFPPCNCQKCKKLRSEGKPDQESCGGPRNIKVFGATKASDFFLEDATFEFDNSMEKYNSSRSNTIISNKFNLREDLPRHKNGNFSFSKFGFTASNLSSVLFDIVGVMAFFIMASAMFWITIYMYLWRFIIVIYKSGRKAQIISLVLLALLCVVITFHAMQGRHKHRQIQALQMSSAHSPTQLKNETTICSQEKCHHQNSAKCNKSKCSTHNLQDSKSTEYFKRCNAQKDKIKSCGKCNLFKFKKSKSSNSLNNCKKKKSKTPSLCDLCSKEMKTKKLISNPILSDDEAREMFKKSKLYAIPTEMKSPPPSLAYLVDYLSNYFYGSSGITVATLPPF